MAVSASAWSVRRFKTGIDASAAVEFALVFPVLLILMIVGIDIVAYVNAVRKTELLAATISEMISQAAPPIGSTTATVAAADLHFSYDSGLVVFPYLMKDAARQSIAWWQDIYIDYASIKFTAIPGASCTGQADLSSCYTAAVVWTSSGTTGGNYRPCLIPQLAQSNTSPPNKAFLPASIFGPTSIIAVDIVFTFTPTFGSAFITPLRIARSVFVQPRYAALITYSSTGNDGTAQSCI